MPGSVGLLLRPTAVAFSLQAGVIGVLQTTQSAKEGGKGTAGLPWMWTVVDVPAGVDGDTAESKLKRCEGSRRAFLMQPVDVCCSANAPRGEEKLLTPAVSLAVATPQKITACGGDGSGNERRAHLPTRHRRGD